MTCAFPEPNFVVGRLLEDTPGFRRLAQCASCAETFPLPAEELVARHGPEAPIEEALDGLRCPVCGAATIRVTMIAVR